MVKIGTVEIDGLVGLAPMAGVADRAMRELCREYGAAYTVGELASARGICLDDRRSAGYLFCADATRPAASQLFGSDPAVMAAAAEKALTFSPDFLDINMGCPAPKIAGNGGGSALMRDPVLAEKIVRAVVSVATVPVTVKMRTGWDSEHKTAVEIAKRCEAAGVAAITVHGRTRTQMYAPLVDYETVRAVKQAVSVPVIGNGDVQDGKSAREMMEKTGCDLVAVGRAAMGNPFVFAEINAFLQGRDYCRPPLAERLLVLKRQIALMERYKDEHIAMLEARKHAAWYMNGLRGAADLRRMCGEISCPADVERVCEKALELNAQL